jgi:RecA-family ATPase
MNRAFTTVLNGDGVNDEPPFPNGPDDYGTLPPATEVPQDLLFDPITPAIWRGTPSPEKRWLASRRIPAGDLTILAGNGGSGKTEIAVQLLVAVAADLMDWLGCVVETGGTALFISCEEPEEDIRDRVERICKHRHIDPYGLERLHLKFPDLDATALAAADREGRIAGTPLLASMKRWIEQHQPRLVVIDSAAAVFDGVAIDRRQVRAFLAMLRKIARAHDVAILLLDHPSVRGMADGTGTANSVDWRNTARAMILLSEPKKDDPDARTLEVKKTNRGRTGEQIHLRWTGLTFTVAAAGTPSPHKAKTECAIDELFLRILDKRNVQKRPVHAKKANGGAPSEFATDPDANGAKADAFRAAMERLFAAGKIRNVEDGPPSKRRSYIERVVS